MTLAKRCVTVAGSRCLDTVARTSVLDWCREPVVFRVIPYLLDPRVIADVPVLRPLRGLRVRVLCNPYNPFHRPAYWFGRLHERELELLLRRVLRPGDTFLDIGSNFGHFAFLAAALVRPEGQVHAVEPHPKLAALIDAGSRSQSIAPVHVHAVALGDREGAVALRVNPKHIGASTVRSPRSDDSAVEGFAEEYTVPVRLADNLFSGLREGRGSIIAKIDVEGHEPAVIRGMGRLLLSLVDAAVVEVTPQWIGGPDGVVALFNRMSGLGFAAFRLESPWIREVRMRPCNPAGVQDQCNVLFAKPAFLHAHGLDPKL